MNFAKLKRVSLFSVIIAIVPVILLAGEITWYSFEKGYDLARQKRKPVVIDFYADWCMWCKVMDDKTFSDAEVQKKMARDYVAIRIDMQKSGTINYNGTDYTPQQFAGMLGVEGLPTLVFMDKQGKFVTRIPGFVKPDIFKVLLDYMKEECYSKQVTFKEYMKDNGCQR